MNNAPESENHESQIANHKSRATESQIINHKSEIRNDRKGAGGPRTPEGKLRSSLNSLQHGCYAESQHAKQALGEKVGRQYEEVLAEMRAHFKPRDPLEELLVQRIARAAWRTLLTRAAEDTELLNHNGSPVLSHDYDRMIRNERFIDIQLHRALLALDKKKERDKMLRNELDLARLRAW